MVTVSEFSQTKSIRLRWEVDRFNQASRMIVSCDKMGEVLIRDLSSGVSTLVIALLFDIASYLKHV